MGSFAIRLTLMMALLAGAASSAEAQAPPPPPQSGFEYHQGIMVGFGIGLATFDCDGCDADVSFGFDFNLGGFLNPRLALMYDAAAWIDSENGATLTLSTNTVAAQYWAAPKIWVKGGAGLALIQASYEGNSDSESGLGLTGAAGFEVMQSGNFTMDISGRLGIMDFDGGNITMVHGLLGFRWK